MIDDDDDPHAHDAAIAAADRGEEPVIRRPRYRCGDRTCGDPCCVSCFPFNDEEEP